jgi:hypothetical protein
MTAAPSLNLSYIGNGPTGANQSIAQGTSGPVAKTLYAYGVATNGNTTTAANAAPVGFIDGVQSLGKTIVLQFQSVGAPASYQGTANQAYYASVQGVGQLQVGQSITFAGFSNSGNNTTATINYVTGSGVYVTNSSSVAETNPAATGTVQVSSVPIFVDVFISGNSADTAGDLAVAAAAFYPSSLSSTGFTLNWAALATTARTIHFGAIIGFSS